MSGWARDNSCVRVLIAEPCQLVRETLVAALEQQPGLASAAHEGQLDELADGIARTQATIVLLSINDAVNWLEVAQRLGSTPRVAPMVLLDEKISDANARHALRLGAAGYLVKSQPLAQVVAAIRSAASGQRVFASEIARRIILTVQGMELPPARTASALARLTARELDVLTLIAQGCSVKRAAELLGLSASTVDNHKSRLMKKLGVHKAVELTRVAIMEGLIAPTAPRGESHRGVHHRYESAHAATDSAHEAALSGARLTPSELASVRAGQV